jgi:hypothetical protein
MSERHKGDVTHISSQFILGLSQDGKMSAFRRINEGKLSDCFHANEISYLKRKHCTQIVNSSTPPKTIFVTRNF